MIETAKSSRQESGRAIGLPRLMVFAAFALMLAMVALGTQSASGAGPVLYRVNAGGVEQEGTPTWSTDTAADPSDFLELADQQNNKAATSTVPVTLDSTVPSTVNPRIFASHRHDPRGGDPYEMLWHFPVENGPVEVRLYFAEVEVPEVDPITAPGQRMFDVQIEGTTVLEDFDVFAEVGPQVGTMRSFLINVEDGIVDLGFFHVTQHTMISGIEIIDWTGDANLAASPNPLSINALTNDSGFVTVNVINNGALDGSGPAVRVDDISLTGSGSASFTENWAKGSTWLAPGEATSFKLTYLGLPSPGQKTANLVVEVAGSGDITFPVTGTTVTGISSLSVDPTSLGFGSVTIGSPEEASITLRNTGGATESPIDVTSAAVSGSNANYFTVLTPLPLTIEPGKSAQIAVRYGPGVTGSHNATLRVDHNGGNSPAAVPLSGTGQTGFTDIGNSVFKTEINWLAAQGVTKGCNPPTNTKFCPTEVVTRGQMAAFLHRALDGVLTPGPISEFIDDNNSVFEADIEWLGATGVTKGCNPPANDEFCPDKPVTRGQMAAFLHRALDGVLTPGAIPEYSDDNTSVFEADIEWLGATGVTKGCNPPANDKFCPNDPVTREQMAAFLFRALGG